MSSIDLAPLHITFIFVLDSWFKSEDTSNVFSLSKCTPPIPPVEKNLMPTKDAKYIDEATVVAAWVLLFIDIDRLCIETFSIFLDFANIFISFSFKPILIFPSIMAIVAGIDPFNLTALIEERAIFKFSG